jgi:hypothetical protein
MMKNDQLMAEVGAKVDAQAKVLYAQRRRASLASQNMENGEGEKDDRESSKGEVAPSSKDKCEDEEKVKTDESEDKEKVSLESDSKESSDA